MNGFFASSTLIASSKPDLSSAAMLLPKCGACGMFRTCHTPKMPVYGRGERKILIVGSFPSMADDSSGKPFSGKAGQFLGHQLSNMGIDLYRDCWSTFAMICFPGDRNKFKNEVDHCRPNLLRIINEKRPNVVILMGQFAVKSLISWTWKEGPGEMDRWAGWQIPDQSINAWICPMIHPAWIKEQIEEDTFTAHLSAAIEKADKRPWKHIPKWKDNVHVEMDDFKAAKMIREITRMNKPTAADYENNALKPEYKGAKILSCSLSVMGSKSAISFPWGRRVREAMAGFWFSMVPKIATNAKHEDRWTRKEYGRRIKNWYWDTMIAAHVLDCRPGITSLKFQVYVLRGVGEYNEHIEPYLAASKGQHINLAETEIALEDLLMYGGEDGLYEGEVAECQIGRKF